MRIVPHGHTAMKYRYITKRGRIYEENSEIKYVFFKPRAIRHDLKRSANEHECEISSQWSQKLAISFTFTAYCSNKYPLQHHTAISNKAPKYSYSSTFTAKNRARVFVWIWSSHLNLRYLILSAVRTRYVAETPIILHFIYLFGASEDC